MDGEFSLFGSLNLDPRSLWLNFEITLAVYDQDFTAVLRDLQQRYIADSQMMDTAAWMERPIHARFTANLARLLDVADSVIAGTSIKVDGVTTNPVDPQRAADFVVEAHRARD